MMAKISNKDYRDILDVVYSVNGCEDRESFLDTLMPSMINMFHADCVTFHLIQGYPQHIKVVESRSFKSEKHSMNEDRVNSELYKANYFKQSLLLREAVSSSKVILKFGESVSLKQWESSELYNNFILPQNLYWEMFMTLRWKNDLEGMLTLWRTKNLGNYQDREMSKAEILAPHLMQSTRNMLTLSRMNLNKAKLLGDDGSNSEGVLLMDSKMNPLYINPAARQICFQINHRSQPWSKFKDHGEYPIPDCVIQDCSSLLELFKKGDHPVLWPVERMVIVSDGLKYKVESSLIWKADQINPQPNFIITMGSFDANNDAPVDLQAKYKLSRRELDIIYYYNQGLSYSEIGEKLFISKLTVHTHIKNIYRKLGAKNRIELYHYIQSPNALK
jgi:DNA-binding CsgD family transcriptional regulator